MDKSYTFMHKKNNFESKVIYKLEKDEKVPGHF